MASNRIDSSDSEKNFDEEPTKDDFLDESGDEGDEPGKIRDDLWGRSSFDFDQLHQLRELYNTRRKNAAEEEDEQEYLDALKERNTDELQSLRQVL
jgi:hypothetical protein